MFECNEFHIEAQLKKYFFNVFQLFYKKQHTSASNSDIPMNSVMMMMMMIEIKLIIVTWIFITQCSWIPILIGQSQQEALG